MDKAVLVKVDFQDNGTLTVRIGSLSHDRHTGLSQTAARDLLLKTAAERGPLEITSRHEDGRVVTEMMDRDGKMRPLADAGTRRAPAASASHIFNLTEDEVSPAQMELPDSGWSSVEGRFTSDTPVRHRTPVEDPRAAAGMLSALGVGPAAPKKLGADRTRSLDPSINQGRDNFGNLIVEPSRPARAGRSGAGSTTTVGGLFSGVSEQQPSRARQEKEPKTLDTIFGDAPAARSEEGPRGYEELPPRKKSTLGSFPAPRRAAADTAEAAGPAAQAAQSGSAAGEFDPNAVEKMMADAKAKAKAEADAAAAQRARRKKIRSMSWIAIGAVLLAAIVTIAVSQLFGARADTGVSYTEVEEMTVGEPVKVLPEYAETASWEHTISEDAAVTAFPQAVVVAEGKKLELFSPEDGSPIRTITTDQPVEYSFAATVGERKTLGFRTGSKLVLWPVDAGAKGDLIEVDLTDTGVPLEDLKVSAEGQSLLIRDETNGAKNWTVTDQGLVRLHSTVSGQTLMAVDGDTLVLSTGGTQAFRTDLDGSNPRKTDLQAPGEDLNSTRWITAGYNRVVVAWAPNDESTEWALTVHDLDTGEVISTVPISMQDAQKKVWLRGVGEHTAAFGPYLFSMTDGSLLSDGSELGADFTKVYGPFGQAITTEGLAYAVDSTIYPSQSQLLSVADDNAIVMTDPTTISSYQRTSGEV